MVVFKSTYQGQKYPNKTQIHRDKNKGLLMLGERGINQSQGDY